MLTREQKAQEIKESKNLVKESKFLIFVDFTGTTVEDFKKLRRALLAIGSKLKVVKKKLLRVALEEDKIDFNPERFDSQVGTIFSSADISEIANPIYKFFKETKNKEFKILGGYDLSEKIFIEGEIVSRIGQLPSREVLLGQLAGMLTAPVKMFLYVLDQKSKQTVEK